MFRPVYPKAHFPTLEKEILEYWREKKIFERSVSERKKKEFTFYDGPPFATGLPHYGHILAGVMKDVVPRYWTMKGYRVERRFGWDCHGLPVENEIEKEKGMSGKRDIEKMGVAAFNEACRSIVQRYAHDWRTIVERTGRWVDMDNDYKTMDTSYMETIWWVFKQLWDKGLIYEGYKSMHICPHCVTPLSNFEVTLGYKEITDASATAKFKLDDKENTYVLAWTTTPWTLPGNMALAVHPDFTYVKVKAGDQFYIVVEELKDKVFAHIQDAETIEKIKGRELVGKTYEPLFPYFAAKKKEGAFRIVPGDFVSTEEGTGVVHIAPGYGEDDYNISVKENLPFVQHVTMEGKFTEDVTEYAGQDVKPKDDPRKMDMKMADYLEQQGTLFARINYPHSYPHCWRCDTPLLNYATNSWFVSVTKIKEQLLANNDKIYWLPENIKKGRFGKWLENARDWAISRSRYWGSALPLWRCDGCEIIEVLGSLEDLHKKVPDRVLKKGKIYVDKKTGQEFDLHKHIVDELTWPCHGNSCHGTMRRIPEVLDCWFESGSMPYAQMHYPFENKAKFEKNFPADFIAEGQDQTRGWFYTLHVLATALTLGPKPAIPTKKCVPAFKNVIVNGIVLAEDGKKMSKRLKNYPDPVKIMDSSGADAMRFYLMNSPAVQAQDLRFSEKGVDEVVKSVILPFWNAYSFFVTYANIDKFQPTTSTGKFSNKLDQWILSDLQATVEKVTAALDGYDLAGATAPLSSFLDALTNWYIRRSRRRFWKSENDTDKKQAYTALYTVLTTLSQLMAPYTPFISEEVYRNLTGEDSVHLSLWPRGKKTWLNKKLNEEVETVRNVVTLGLSARARSKIKVRQPLGLIEVIVPHKLQKVVKEYKDIILEELNVKDMKLLDESADVAQKVLKPIGAKVGPKFGKDAQKIFNAAKENSYQETGAGVYTLTDPITGFSGTLTTDEVDISYVGKEGFDVEADKGIVVALDTKVTEDLRLEGVAREIVRTIQDMRKEANYHVADRIQVSIEGCDAQVLQQFGDYIQAETLATIVPEITQPDGERVLEVEGQRMTVRIKK